MINVRNTLRGGGSEVNINMGPLVDMVFLLLIFFVVTTSFVKETGIDVHPARLEVAQREVELFERIEAHEGAAVALAALVHARRLQQRLLGDLLLDLVKDAVLGGDDQGLRR